MATWVLDACRRPGLFPARGSTTAGRSRPRRWRAVWKGDYLSLWRTPPGQSGHLSNGYHGTAADWMGQRLDTLQNRGLLPATARSLREKVEAFQRSKGIEVNGRASPTTLILLNRATGVDEPRLSPANP